MAPGRGRTSAGGVDTIVVGAGFAGCVLAARLSQDPGRKILLREARPDYPTRRALPPEIADGTTVAETHDWGSYNEPHREATSRVSTAARGQGTSGSA